MPDRRIDVSQELFERVERKASQEHLRVSDVVAYLLLRWVAGEVALPATTRDDRVAAARGSRGMWKDRDPDAYLASSRAGLAGRDEELGNARLAV